MKNVIMKLIVVFGMMALWTPIATARSDEGLPSPQVRILKAGDSLILDVPSVVLTVEYYDLTLDAMDYYLKSWELCQVDIKSCEVKTKIDFTVFEKDFNDVYDQLEECQSINSRSWWDDNKAWLGLVTGVVVGSLTVGTVWYLTNSLAQ